MPSHSFARDISNAYVGPLPFGASRVVSENLSYEF